MIKRFCDLCDSEIQGQMYRVLSLAGPKGKIPYVEGQPLGTYIPETEICPACVNSILHTVHGIISGSAADPTYEVMDDG